MQLINSQYRIIEVLEEDKYGSKYLVQDIHKDNFIKKMRVIENTAETAAFIDYMKANFFDYINIIHPNIIRCYYFNRVRVINTKPIVSNKFYYTYENIEGQNLFDYVMGKDIEELLDLCVQLLSAVKYLHLRGFVLCSINPNDIYVVLNEDKKQIKIAAFPYAIYTDNSVIINKDNSYFKSPESLQFGQYDKGSDIYLLGIILYHIFSGENIEKSIFNANGIDLLLNPNAKELFRVIQKCTASNSSARYTSIDAIIEDINGIFNKSFSIIDKKHIETLPMFSTKLVARENFLKRLIQNIRSYFYENKSIKLSAITGDFGTGKGALTNLFMTRLNFEGEYAVYTALNKDSTEDYSGIRDIIKKILKYADKDLTEKYYDQLCKLIPELAKREKVASLVIGEEDDESYKMAYRLGNFILETSLKWPFVIIIKNYDYIDEQSKKIINYVMRSQDKGKVCFVVSFYDEISHENVINYFKPQLQNSEIDIIQLSNFNIYETAEAIRILLGMGKAPIDFAAKLYRETEGNPYLVYKTIYAIFLDKHIYVDDKGNWVLNNVDFSKINLSVNIDEISQNKINKLDPAKRKVLDIISIFNTAMSIDILESMSGINLEELLSILESLIYLNILSRRMDDWGITYDFTSMSLKKTVYESIDEYTAFKYHEKASKILEKKYFLEKRENKDELIYQMSKSGRCAEAVDYLIISANDMIKKNLLSQAIQFLKQGYDLLDKDEICPRKTEVSIKLGDLYYQIGENNKCLRYYKIAEKNAQVFGDKRLLSDIYIKMIYVNYKRNDIKKCLEYSRLAKKEIKSIQYKEGMLDLILALSDLMIYRRKLTSLIGIIETVLKELNKDNKYYYGMLMSAYGRALYRKSRYEEAIKALNQSIETLEELQEYEGLVAAMSAMGTIYSEYYNDIKKAKEYFEKTLIICQRINNIPYMMLSYNNLAEIYRIEDLYNESLVYYNKALDLAERYPNIYIQSILYVNCAMVSMEMQNYKRYIQYMDKAKSVIFTYKDSGDAINHYYINEAIFFYLMGLYKDALNYSQKSVNVSESWGISIDSDLALVNILCKAKLYGEMNFCKLKDFCISIFENKSYKVSRLACHKIAELYIDQNNYDEAKSFLELSERFKEFIDTPYLDIVYKYLSAMTYKGKKRLDLLTALIEQADMLDNNEIKWKIYKSIGVELIETGDLFGALKNLITSFNCLRILVDGVPNDYKIQFLQSHNRNTVKEKLLILSQKITGQEGLVHGSVAFAGEIKDIDNSINEYFDYKNFKDLMIKDSGTSYKNDIDLIRSMQGKFLLDFLHRINSFSSNIEDNIKELVELFMSFTQAKNAFLAIIDESNDMRMIYSNLRNDNTGFYKYITEKAGQTGESVIIPDVFEYKKKVNDSLIPKDISAVFCIPITPSEVINNFKKDRRRGDDTSSIKGYLYLDTDSIINNFSEETGDLCISISKIAYILIDNYNLKMVNAVDKLTKLYTRKYFENALLNELSNAVVKGGEFSIIMADIDKFKAINDRYGHQVGDEILAKIAELIMNSVRKTDICARYGGEEFIILLPSTDSDGALYLAEKIRKKIESTNLNIHHNSITISMGIATYPVHSTWMKDLIDKADQALYHSKENGRNNTTVYDDNLAKTAKRVDKLAGIVSGNMSEDIKNVENIIEILELQRNKDISNEDKIFKFLGRIIEISGAQKGSIFILNDDNKPVRQIARRSMVSNNVIDKTYNVELLNKCINNGNGEYLIDWSSSVSIDTVTGMPDWQSIMIIPITNCEKINAVLYLSVSLKIKEFDANIYNYINTLCNLIAPVFLCVNN